MKYSYMIDLDYPVKQGNDSVLFVASPTSGSNNAAGIVGAALRMTIIKRQLTLPFNGYRDVPTVCLKIRLVKSLLNFCTLFGR